MQRYTRANVKESTYRRALKHPDKEWAKEIISRYEKQGPRLKKLARYQKENKIEWTPAERAFARLLQSLRIYYIREHCFNCRDGRDYFVDFFIKKGRVAFEIDGAVHKKQETYDTHRDISLMSDYRIIIMRFTNDDVFYRQEYVKQTVLEALRQRWDEQSAKMTRKKISREKKQIECAVQKIKIVRNGIVIKERSVLKWALPC